MGFFDKFLGPTVAAAIDGLTDKVVKATREEIQRYAPQLIGIAKEQFEKYMPEIIDFGKEQWDKYGPQLIDMAQKELHDQFEQWMPILMTGLSKTVTLSLAKVGEQGIDKLTDLTPTDIDDKFVDPIAKEVFDWLGTVFNNNIQGAIQQSSDGRS